MIGNCMTSSRKPHWACQARGTKFSATEFMQYLKPVGSGPSSNT